MVFGITGKITILLRSVVGPLVFILHFMNFYPTSLSSWFS